MNTAIYTSSQALLASADASSKDNLSTAVEQEEPSQNKLILDAFHDYKKRGFDPLPIYYINGFPSKEPIIKEWQKKAINREFTDTDFDGDCNIGLVLGGPQNLTDIDLDAEQAVKIGNVILDEMMDSTEKTIMFGRQGKPRSHYFFASDKSLSSERIVDPLNSKLTIVEYRCVKQDGTRGLQSIVPPSLWCDTKNKLIEEINFEADSTDELLEVPSAVLHHKFRVIAATSLLCRHFPVEGQRHDCMLALAGLFAGSSIQEELATTIVTLAYRFSAGFNRDEYKAAAAVKSAYKDVDEPDLHLYGYPHLTRIIDKVVVDRVLELLGISRRAPETPQSAKNTFDVDEDIRMLEEQHIQKLNIKPREYLIDGLIVKKRLHMLSGKPGDGKSTLILQWLLDIVAQTGMRVVYLDRDNGDGEARDRADRLGTLAPNFLWWGDWKLAADGTADPVPNLNSPRLDAMIKKLGDCIVIIDTLTTFGAGMNIDENSNSDMAKILSHPTRWRSYGATIIVVHHPDKNGKHASRGASSMNGIIDYVMEAKSTFREGSRHLKTTTITHDKAQGAESSVRYNWDDKGVPHRQNSTLEDALISLLTQHPGVNKGAFEDLAIDKVLVSREKVRRFVEDGIRAGTISHVRTKLAVIDPLKKLTKRNLLKKPSLREVFEEGNDGEFVN